MRSSGPYTLTRYESQPVADGELLHRHLLHRVPDAPVRDPRRPRDQGAELLPRAAGGGVLERVPAGQHQVRVEFAYDGGGLGKGGTYTLFVDGTQVAEGRIENTVPMLFSGDETTDVGTDSATPVTDDFKGEEVKFNGRVNWVQIDLGEDAEDADHLISPEERFRIAMARQ